MKKLAASEKCVAGLNPPVDVLLSCAGVADGTPGLPQVNFIGQRHLIEAALDRNLLPAGGAIGMMAVLTKNELVLIIVGGLFVIETLSVIIQRGAFKITKRLTGTGKRVFAMAPIHHHYEKIGWEEPKIIVRFWLVSALLALLALGTLKLR